MKLFRHLSQNILSPHLLVLTHASALSDSKIMHSYDKSSIEQIYMRKSEELDNHILHIIHALKQ